MKKVISIILAISLMLTLCISMPFGVSAAGIDEGNLYKPTTSMAGTNYWPDQLKYEDTEEGLRIYYAEALTNNSLRQASLTTAYKLDGLHFTVEANAPTLGSAYYGKLYYFALKNAKSNSGAANLLTIKLDSNAGSGGQVVVTVNGVAVSNTSVASVAGATEFDFYFNLEANGDLTVSINGTDLTVEAANIKAAGIDTADLYWYSYPQVNTEAATDIVLKSIHDGDDICAKVIDDINAEYVALDKTSYSYTKDAVDLYLKATKLSAAAKRYVIGYADLVEAAYTATDADYHRVYSSEIQNYWSGNYVNTTDNESGMRFQWLASSGVNYNILGPYTKNAKNLDGMEISYTYNAGGEMTLVLGLCNAGNQDGSKTSLRFAIEPNGWIYVESKGARVTTDLIGGIKNLKSSGLTANDDYRIDVRGIVTKNNNIIDFDVDALGNLALIINGNTLAKFSAEFLTNAGLDASKTYLKFGNQGQLLDFNLDYIRNGGEISMNEITEGRFNKVTADDIGHHGWNAITKTEVEDGYRIQHTETTDDYVFAHWTKKPVELDGASVSYTLNAATYYSRIINIGLSNSTGNHDKNSTNINFQFEPNGWIKVHAKGALVTSYEYGEAYKVSDTDYRLHCVDYLNMETSTYEVRFELETNGALSLYLNDTKLLSLSAETVAASGINTGETYVKFSNINDGDPLDYTIHNIRTGYLNEIKHFEKPECVSGDANADGQTDIIDLVRAKKHLVDDTTPIFTSATDLNSEGEERINALDLSELRKLLLNSF